MADQITAVPVAVSKWHKIAWVLLVVLLLGSAGGWVWYQRQHVAVSKPATSSVGTGATSTTSTTTSSPALFTGTVQKISTDLGLFKKTDAATPVTYYSAGTYASGPLTGYERIIAVVTPDSPGVPVPSFLVTKDRKIFSVFKNPLAATNSLDGWDAAKVTAVVDGVTEAPDTITLNDSFGAVQIEVTTAFDQSNTTGTNPLLLDTDISARTLLGTTSGGLKMYDDPYAAQTIDPSADAASKTYVQTKNTYFQGTTGIAVIDSAGLVYTYREASATTLAAYVAAKPAYDAAVKAYNVAVAKIQASSTPNANYPDYPNITEPNLFFEQSEATTTQPLYSTYHAALTSVCSSDDNAWVAKGITDGDLTKIGTVRGQDMFVLKDANNPLYTAQYNRLPDDADFKDANKGLSKPTFAEYVAKNPIIFMKDYFGRYYILGEYQFVLPSGCGKPVVYLYPPQTETVKVQFTAPMTLTTSVPTYNNGWTVSAKPNGQLTDLQPQNTDCAQFSPAKFGQEYAAAACASHTYPYLFWAGQGHSVQYPTVTTGWVVSSSDLAAFMNKTLDNVGFTATEKNDMLSYWLPTLEKTSAPYYRISFLNTAQMNQIAPMSIVPQPDNLYRLFLDWQPLVSKPTVPIAPQQLEKVNRTGFTAVEWGGLNR